MILRPGTHLTLAAHPTPAAHPTLSLPIPLPSDESGPRRAQRSADSRQAAPSATIHAHGDAASAGPPPLSPAIPRNVRWGRNWKTERVGRGSAERVGVGVGRGPAERVGRSPRAARPDEVPTT